MKAKDAGLTKIIILL